MTQSVLLLGGYGQIGNAIYEKIKRSHDVYRTNSQNFKLGGTDDYSKLLDLISEKNPRLIINCIGKFSDNNGDLQEIFNVNVRPSWHIIKIFSEFLPGIEIDYSVIGSSSYSQGKKDYYLYSSSKAALVNLIHGASFSVEQRFNRLNVINLPPVMSKMSEVANHGSSGRKGISLSEAADFVLGASLYRFIPGVIDYCFEKELK